MDTQQTQPATEGADHSSGQAGTGFLSDIQTIRARARQHIEKGAVTPGYDADRASVLKLLNEALATEIVCTLRYRRHYFMAQGILGESVKKEFLQHAQEEQGHADQLAERIIQLGGEPNFDPNGLSARSHAEYIEGSSLEEMIKEDLIAERIAIESYKEMIEYFGPRDPTTRRLMESILAKEEEHAEELASMMEDIRELLGSGAPAGSHDSAVDDSVKDPTRSFDSPMQVLEQDDLSDEDKHRILTSWVKDCELLSEAEAENMGGGERTGLREVKLALAQLEKHTTSVPLSH